jgi:hypothetical protein
MMEKGEDMIPDEGCLRAKGRKGWVLYRGCRENRENI